MKHDNLVELLGYCIENDEFILVYEYLANNSVRKILSSKSPNNIFTIVAKSSLTSLLNPKFVFQEHELSTLDWKGYEICIFIKSEVYYNIVFIGSD